MALMFPLETLPQAQLHKLCQVMWGWGEPCARFSQSNHCDADCQVSDCSWSRFPRLESFFQYYRGVTESYLYSPYTGPLPQGGAPAIESHDDVLNMIQHIQLHLTVKRFELTTQYFTQRDADNIPHIDDQHRAFNLAARVLVMIPCSVDGQTGGGRYESGSIPSVWRKNESIIDFIKSIFPSRDSRVTATDEAPSARIKATLKATRLKKRAELSFAGTSDLRHHLSVDDRTGVVKVFHYTSVLKENLEALGKSTVAQDASALPEQLLLETLDSVQEVLFPYELDSQAFLKSLISEKNFDPECEEARMPTNYVGQRSPVRYTYWHSRLMDLYDEVKNPKARSWFAVWLEKKSRARHTMLAALVGIFIAIVIGLLALVVAVIQTYIAWEAWKHPVSSD